MATRRVSARYDRRMPSSWLTTGGLTKRKYFSPRGAPLRSTSSNGSPTSRSASSCGLAIVADEQMNVGIRPVVPADAPQPAQDVGQMAAEHAAIRVQLVDDDVAQVLEQLGPARMVRQDARVQHVGIAQHDVRARADRAPRVLRRVAVVGEHADVVARLRPRPAGPSGAARRAGPAPAPWSGTDTAPATTHRRGCCRAPARCSRASCPTPSA